MRFLRLLGWVYAALALLAVETANYLAVWWESGLPSWVMVVLGLSLLVVCAVSFRWATRRHLPQPAEEPRWLRPLVAMAIGVTVLAGPVVGRLMGELPLLRALSLYGVAVILGALAFVLRRDWPSRRSRSRVTDGAAR